MAPTPPSYVVDFLVVVCLLLIFLPVADTNNSNIIKPSLSIQKSTSIRTTVINLSKTATPTVRPTPSSVSATNSSNSRIHPTSAKISPTRIRPSSSSVHHHSVVPTSPVRPTAFPCPTCCCDDCGSYKSKMWVATGFAIVLGIINAILIFLMVRQQRIHRDIELDPALSRLI